MKHTTEKHQKSCGCRSAGECSCNIFAWKEALEACVDDFATEMKKKLIKKAMQGYTGWDDPGWTYEEIIERLKEHIAKGDMIDIANFAMFAWNKEK